MKAQILFLVFVPYIFLIETTTAARILLIGETNDTQLVDLFQESKSSDFQITPVYVNHEEEDALQNNSFCGFLNAQVHRIYRVFNDRDE